MTNIKITAKARFTGAGFGSPNGSQDTLWKEIDTLTSCKGSAKGDKTYLPADDTSEPQKTAKTSKEIRK